MLVPREYLPEENDVLYHYCDANAFLSICTNKKMRFSDIFSMNDFMEMHWGYHIWELAASEVMEEVGRDFLDSIDEVIHSSGMFGLVAASSFSLEGDVLSQWRAYADDGRGYAIGFKATEMTKLPVRGLLVLYDQESQVAEVTRVIKGLYAAEQSHEEKLGDEFREICYLLAFDLAAFKNPSFVEEREVRLIHLLNFEASNDFLKLVDPGGEAFGEPSPGVPISFRMRESVPVPFIDQDFTHNGTHNPIKEIVIGPRNDGLPSNLSVFLETVGIGSVEIKKSTGTYR